MFQGQFSLGVRIVGWVEPEVDDRIGGEIAQRLSYSEREKSEETNLGCVDLDHKTL